MFAGPGPCAFADWCVRCSLLSVCCLVLNMVVCCLLLVVVLLLYIVCCLSFDRCCAVCVGPYVCADWSALFVAVCCLPVAVVRYSLLVVCGCCDVLTALT